MNTKKIDVAENNAYWDQKYARQQKVLNDMKSGKVTHGEVFAFDRTELRKGFEVAVLQLD